jgi:thiol:disulfide interchange protein DsbD
MRYALFKLIFILLLLPVAGFAQNPTKWSLTSDVKGREIKTGSSFSAQLTVSIEPGWHLYALDQPAGGPVPTSIKITAGRSFEIRDLTSQIPISQPDTLFIVDN